MTTAEDDPSVRIIQIEARHIGVQDVWRSKDEIAQKERESRKVWADLDDEQRQAMLVLVRDALMRMIEDPHVWVPVSIEPKSGNRLDIFISIHLAEVDDEVLKRRVETERLIDHTTRDLVVLRNELSPAEPDADGPAS